MTKRRSERLVKTPWGVQYMYANPASWSLRFYNPLRLLTIFGTLRLFESSG